MAGEDDTTEPESAEEHRLRGPWWYSQRRSVTPEQRHEVLSQLFYEGPDLVPFLARFAALMGMAVLVAVFGLAQNSGPVVIGAMLISPLTTPILGLATALVLGHPRRQLNALLILLGASVGGIGLAVLASFLLPDPRLETLGSAQLLARTEPDIIDLAVAVVAGAAGAYVLVRREAVSALPGVAIAVALVPPLATIGVTLELGRGDLAAHALLLYVTNLAGIVLASAVVMLLLGVGARPQPGGLPRRIKVGLGTAALAAVVVSIPLAIHTRRIIHDSRDRDDAEQLASDWLAGTKLTLGNVDLEGTDHVEVDVSGVDRPPDPTPLARELAKKLDEPITVTLRWTPAETKTVTAAP